MNYRNNIIFNFDFPTFHITFKMNILPLDLVIKIVDYLHDDKLKIRFCSTNRCLYQRRKEFRLDDMYRYTTLLKAIQFDGKNVNDPLTDWIITAVMMDSTDIDYTRFTKLKERGKILGQVAWKVLKYVVTRVVTPMPAGICEKHKLHCNKINEHFMQLPKTVTKIMFDDNHTDQVTLPDDLKELCIGSTTKESFEELGQLVKDGKIMMFGTNFTYQGTSFPDGVEVLVLFRITPNLSKLPSKLRVLFIFGSDLSRCEHPDSATTYSHLRPSSYNQN